MGISGIILAGGQSMRMGRDKTLMTYNNETLVEHTVKEMGKFADEIIIASNNTNKYNLPGIIEVPDIYQGMGPLAGIHAGLIRAKFNYAFVASCDMPLFSAELAAFLLGRCEGYDVVVPDLGEYSEPLCAVYSKECLGPIEKCLKNNIRKVIKFYPDVKVLKVSKKEFDFLGEAERLFFNLNTPEDYRVLLGRKM